MSRLGLFVCLLMLVAVAVCLDMPANLKPPAGKDAQDHLPPGHPQHPDAPQLDGQHPDAPRPEGGQMPKGDKPDAKPQDAKS